MEGLWTFHALVLACGGVTGFALALTGGGGSILAVPLLIYVVGMDNIHLVIGTSALAVSINAYVNLIPHARAKHVHWRKAFLFTSMGIVGALAGSQLGKLMDGSRLISLFAMLMIIMSIFMVRARQTVDASIQMPSSAQLGVRLSSTGIGTGALAGFFGIGGGFLIVPGLMLSARLPIIEAIGTSLFGVGSFGLTTALNYARSGLVDWPIALEFIAGGVMGGWGGAQLATRLASKRGVLNMVFATTVFVVGIYMLLG
ncbi:MAG: sulfite exporter TauE/SafE family protein [Burkholderiaceae bacterium]|nr:sulfite exporter TauE/SafE family protein [Burkholderiaceae bacterium]